jgi:8-oxo-dGTP diphosphatase
LKTLIVAVALILREERCFLQRRSREALHFPCLWELPGGKVEDGEEPLDALRRELWEELRWTASSASPLPVLTHRYQDFAVSLQPFRCTGEQSPNTELAWGWFRLEESLRLPMPEATRELLERNTFKH